MNFDIEQIEYYRTYCDECGWECEAPSRGDLRLEVEAHIWWAHEGEKAEYIEI